MTQISLRLPFAGDFPISFPFGREATNPDLAEKFRAWGVVGHHGVDIALPERTPVFAAAQGRVIQSGENGDWGISVTLKHPWGISIYAHLKESIVTVDQEVLQGDAIGASGSTGAAFGPHLHFGIKPDEADEANGYLGFIDPTPYLSATTSTEAAAETPTRREIPVEQLIDEVLQKRLGELRQKANEERKKRRDQHLVTILALAKQTPITNRVIRETLRVSRATAAIYLTLLVTKGDLSRVGRGRSISYIAR